MHNKREFIHRLQEDCNLPDPEMAERAAQIVLSAFSHRLTPQERSDVAASSSRDIERLWMSM
jgi:uncharacterized protein (DUF2267 family)